MAVFAYIRVSTAKQAEEGLSVDVQESQIEGYAKMNDLAVNVWLRDRGVSGSVPLRDREAGKRIFDEAKDGDIVICSKLDRMFRSAKNALTVLEEMKDRGVKLHYIDLGGSVSNGIGQLVFTILSAVAEQERTRIRERISESKQRMRYENRYQGGRIPVGYKVDEGGILVKDETQQKCIQIMKKKREEGLSYRAISAFLKDELDMAVSHNAIRVLLTGDRKTTI